MRTKFVALFLALPVIAMVSCSRVQEPWDNTGYFKQERARAVTQERELQERLLHGQMDREPGKQQANRT